MTMIAAVPTIEPGERQPGLDRMGPEPVERRLEDLAETMPSAPDDVAPARPRRAASSPGGEPRRLRRGPRSPRPPSAPSGRPSRPAGGPAASATQTKRFSPSRQSAARHDERPLLFADDDLDVHRGVRRQGPAERPGSRQHLADLPAPHLAKAGRDARDRALPRPLGKPVERHPIRWPAATRGRSGWSTRARTFRMPGSETLATSCPGTTLPPSSAAGRRRCPPAERAP